MRAILILIVIAGLWPAPLAAQRALAIDVGTRVRVWSTGLRGVTARVEAATPDTLQIRPEGQTVSVSIPVVSLTRVEISRGQQSRRSAAWTRAKWGALIGAVPGAISLGLQHEQVGGGSSVGKAAALGAWSGGLFGGLIGAAVGAANPGETWERVR